MADFTIKAHDRLPSIAATLTAAGAPVDLTSATGVLFLMRGAGAGGTIRTAAAATIVSAVEGAIRYDWVDADTAVPGEYLAEWQVTWTGGKRQTFPTTSYHTVTVLADLDDA